MRNLRSRPPRPSHHGYGSTAVAVLAGALALWPQLLLAAGSAGAVPGAAASLDLAWMRLQSRGVSWMAQVPIWVVGALLVWLAWQIGARLSRWQRLPRLSGHNPFLHDILRQLLRAGVVLAGVVVALELAGASSLLGTVLGAAGVLGLAVSFALRDTVENYLASVLLSLRQPFAPDDHVVIGESEGRVVRLTPRATILMTLDGNHLRVPNAQVFKARILNYSRNPKRRLQFELGVGSDQPLTHAQTLASRTLAATPGVLPDPGPTCLVTALGDSNVVLACFAWVDQTTHDFGYVRSQAIVRVKRAFDDAGIAMPEPIYTLRWDGASGGEPAPSVTARPGSRRSAPTAPRTDEEPPPPAQQDPLGPQIAADRRRADDRDLLSTDAARE